MTSGFQAMDYVLIDIRMKTVGWMLVPQMIEIVGYRGDIDMGCERYCGSNNLPYCTLGDALCSTRLSSWLH